jgi:hypothetical protein
MDWQNVNGCGRCPPRCVRGVGESDIRSISLSESVGELGSEDKLPDASDMIDSSLIFVWSGRSTLAGLISPWSMVSSTLCRGYAFATIALVDLEKGDSSIGVTLMRDDGESKDCDRMRTLGDGVRGGAITVAMLVTMRRNNS